MFFRLAASGLGFGVVLSLLWGCGAGGDGGPTSVTQERQPNTAAPVLGNGGTTSVGGPATPGGESNGFVGVELGEAPVAMGCQQAKRTFVPQIPTVFILVDRSGSMFDSNAWGPLRTGVLQVISELQDRVRFGFSAFVGGDGQCSGWEVTSPDLNNQAAIAGHYNSLEKPPFKGETPTGAALALASQTLWSDNVEGDKFILYVTDGQPDYCNDGNELCPPDSVVGKLQQLALGLDDTGVQRAPIQTLVFGVDSVLSSISPEVLQAFANAGAGQPVSVLPPPPNQAYDANRIYDQCQGDPGWQVDFTATGKPAVRGQTIGNYVDPLDATAVPGAAKLYRPDPNDQTALLSQFREALSGLKGCSFDLTGDVEVDLKRNDLGDKAKITVNGAAVPFDVTNGWHMLNETTVALEGEACSMWRQPGETSIDFDFPCDVIILR